MKNTFLPGLVIVIVSVLFSPANALARDNRDEQFGRYRQDGFAVQEIKHFNHWEIGKAVAALASGGGGAYLKHVASEVAAKVGEKTLLEALKHPDRVFTRNGVSVQFKIVTINHWHMEKVPRIKFKGIGTSISWEWIRCPELNTASLILLTKKSS